MNSVDITIVRTPRYVTFDCPYCDEEIEMDYDEFTDFMMEDNPSEWEYEPFFCPKCYEELEVGDIDWD